jgi:hypothetical protein
MVNFKINYREDPLFTRNTFKMSGYYEIPLVKKQEIDFTNLITKLTFHLKKKGNSYGNYRKNAS